MRWYRTVAGGRRAPTGPRRTMASDVGGGQRPRRARPQAPPCACAKTGRHGRGRVHSGRSRARSDPRAGPCAKRDPAANTKPANPPPGTVQYARPGRQGVAHPRRARRPPGWHRRAGPCRGEPAAVGPTLHTGQGDGHVSAVWIDPAAMHRPVPAPGGQLHEHPPGATPASPRGARRRARAPTTAHRQGSTCPATTAKRSTGCNERQGRLGGAGPRRPGEQEQAATRGGEGHGLKRQARPMATRGCHDSAHEGCTAVARGRSSINAQGSQNFIGTQPGICEKIEKARCRVAANRLLTAIRNGYRNSNGGMI